MASDGLVGELNEQVVQVLQDAGSTCAEGVEVEQYEHVVDLTEDLIVELLGLEGLTVASRVSVGIFNLSAESESSDQLEGGVIRKQDLRGKLQIFHGNGLAEE